MINSKIEITKTEYGSPRFIEASDAPHYTKLFHNLLKQIDHRPANYEIKTNIWRSQDRSNTYIDVDLRNKRTHDRGIMFYVIKNLIDKLKQHGVDIWVILPAEDGFITLSGGFEE